MIFANRKTSRSHRRPFFSSSVNWRDPLAPDGMAWVIDCDQSINQSINQSIQKVLTPNDVMIENSNSE